MPKDMQLAKHIRRKDPVWTEDPSAIVRCYLSPYKIKGKKMMKISKEEQLEALLTPPPEFLD